MHVVVDVYQHKVYTHACCCRCIST